MEERLKAAHDMFGERLRAVGPDCGLGSWPSREMAGRILVNCAAAVRSFRYANKLD
jgi:5-methyltetrahydropteroyltriglutamate--homocysteine methyltransferase